MSDNRARGAAAIPPTGRRYQGLSPKERVLRRRGAVLDSALELFGTVGYAATPVKAICRGAGLTERYFYESFTDREDCLDALYRDLTSELREATAAAVAGGEDVDSALAAGLEGFVGHLTADPRRAQVILVEVVGVSPAMERRRHAVLSRFAELIAAVWDAGPAAGDGDRAGDEERGGGERPAATGAGKDGISTHARLTAVALAGGLNHLLVDWIMNGRRTTPGELAAVAFDLFTAARRG